MVATIQQVEEVTRAVREGDSHRALDLIHGLDLSDEQAVEIVRACAERNEPAIASVVLRGRFLVADGEHPLVVAARAGHFAMIHMLAKRSDTTDSIVLEAFAATHEYRAVAGPSPGDGDWTYSEFLRVMRMRELRDPREGRYDDDYDEDEDGDDEYEDDEEEYDDILTGLEEGDLEPLRDALAGGLAPDHEISGVTLMEFAIDFNSVDAVKLLMGAGASTTSAVGRAAGWGFVELVEVMLDSGCEATGEAVCEALTSDDPLPILELLLSRGAPAETRRDDGMTAVEVAIYEGRPKAVSLLIEHGASAPEAALEQARRQARELR